MENKYRLPLALHENTPSEKNTNIMQIIVVIGSGILSSSVVATVLKAWLDNRKTKITIQIDGDTQEMAYEGQHLNQDAAAIQAILATLKANTNAAKPVDAVTVELTYDAQKKAYMLEAGKPLHNNSEQAVALQQHAPLKRLLPHWLRRPSPSSNTEQTA